MSPPPPTATLEPWGYLTSCDCRTDRRGLLEDLLPTGGKQEEAGRERGFSGEAKLRKAESRTPKLIKQGWRSRTILLSN